MNFSRSFIKSHFSSLSPMSLKILEAVYIRAEKTERLQLLVKNFTQAQFKNSIFIHIKKLSATIQDEDAFASHLSQIKSKLEMHDITKEEVHEIIKFSISIMASFYGEYWETKTKIEWQRFFEFIEARISPNLHNTSSHFISPSAKSLNFLTQNEIKKLRELASNAAKRLIGNTWDNALQTAIEDELKSIELREKKNL